MHFIYTHILFPLSYLLWYASFRVSALGDVVVQSMEESWDFLQLAPVDEAKASIFFPHLVISMKWP